MAYFEPSIDADGIHIPTYDDIMEYLVSSYKSIFGEDVYIGEDTKDYQLFSIFARCMDDYAALVVDSYNARNPNYAEGDSLDLLLPLVSMTRRGATYSKVVLKCTGEANTVIPEGSSAIDVSGNLWNLDSAVTLDENGEAEVNATCNEAGAIPAPIGDINGIYTPVIGWDAVTNEAEAIMGKNIETDDEVRKRRKNSVNVQNNGSFDALIRALMELEVGEETVEFVSVKANDTNSTDSDGIPAHNICCVVEGLDGHEENIAQAIWKAKAPGIGTYGGSDNEYKESITIKDPYDNDVVVNFARPKKIAVSVTIEINALNGYDEDRILPIIKDTIAGAINGLGIGKAWGVTMAYRDIYNAFMNEQCPFVIVSVEGETADMQDPSTIEVPCAFNEILSIDEDDITITVNT